MTERRPGRDGRAEGGPPTQRRDLERSEVIHVAVYTVGGKNSDNCHRQFNCAHPPTRPAL